MEHTVLRLLTWYIKKKRSGFWYLSWSVTSHSRVNTVETRSNILVPLLEVRSPRIRQLELWILFQVISLVISLRVSRFNVKKLYVAQNRRRPLLYTPLTDMTRLIVAFRNFVTVPKNVGDRSIIGTSFPKHATCSLSSWAQVRLSSYIHSVVRDKGTWLFSTRWLTSRRDCRPARTKKTTLAPELTPSYPY
jgi:hypothetical protein